MAMADSARRLAAVDETAAALGAAPSQTVADAIALNPSLTILEAEPEADQAALEALADWCLRFSPLVAVDAPDGLFLDIAGCAHLWDGEKGLARTLIARLADQGIPVRVGVADTFGAAWALARFGRGEVAIAASGNDVQDADEDLPLPLAGRGQGVGVVGVGSTDPDLATPRLGTFGNVLDVPTTPHPCPPARGEGRLASRLELVLARLPIAALRLEPEIRDRLKRLGLKTVGDLAAIPRPALRKRFGTGCALRLGQAFGELDEPLVFRHPPSPWIERRVFGEPISTPEDFDRTLQDLAERLCARLDTEGLGARRFEAVFHRVDGAAAGRTVSAALPARDPKRICALFAGKLDTLDPGFGVEVVTLLADIVEPVRVAQTDLVDAAADGRDADLAPLIDRLQNKLGADRVWRAVPRQSHVPERAVGRIEPLAPSCGEGWRPDQPRPIRLFARPEPIEAIAPVPDDPPALFRWRGQLHRIRRAEGPERIGAEWWRKSWDENGVDRVRDYYRVEDEDGARFWVFRSGLFGAERPTRWWLHGVFA